MLLDLLRPVLRRAGRAEPVQRGAAEDAHIHGALEPVHGDDEEEVVVGVPDAVQHEARSSRSPGRFVQDAKDDGARAHQCFLIAPAFLLWSYPGCFS
jgi:hypothetical protein